MVIIQSKGNVRGKIILASAASLVSSEREETREEQWLVNTTNLQI